MIQVVPMPTIDEELGVVSPRSVFIVRLVVRFYNGLLLFVAWLAILSLGMTIFGLSQPDSLSGLEFTAAALLTSTAITAVAAVAITTMLQFNFRSIKGQYERLDLIVSWVPLFLLDVVILQAMAGLLLWHTNNFPSEVVVFFAFEVLVLLIAMIIASIWARRKIKSLVGMAHLNTDDTEEMDWNDGPRTPYQDGCSCSPHQP
ncbi:hypothetical protein FOXG_16102 [Fusarium oxysporum f. sp. lycopersici 4287]|uniref:Uncharacterized protein n=2 Tax=Fusarium oxysporum f. sp. lycopersici (strain 4287 / CBS 123668 / FGSC 9935 / NRRL 34936) TaxID=426428 RepID=A0A0J9W7A0_FUSO4|nr:hypothetical protein FOXG_16102 [Fusarium oxysporum f. sp. lycopersici 4287]KAJ9419023.1 hypothetical protein QL093DRAFT_1422446 [Fusarium oxysporum]KNB18610.1 hypothetical protein FOXG_16102 [Fusarium oxysporum f. sp. lycopersici 4287]